MINLLINFVEMNTVLSNAICSLSRFLLCPQLLKLKEKFAKDSRFKLDSRFVESDSEEEEEDVKAEEINEEKSKQMEILSEIVGKKKERPKKIFKPMSVWRYDPDKDGELEDKEPEKKKKKKEKKKHKEEEEKKSEAEEELPEVSQDRFFKVRNRNSL